jgi:hypothetical protein
MEDHGYTVLVENTQDLIAIKSHYQIPPALYSCHTAIVDGYILEGHISVADIARLLTERPDISGLAVPGMPVGSPGMEVEGVAAQPYNAIAFDQAGNTSVFASYGN